MKNWTPFFQFIRDVHGKGLSGSGHMENEVADYLATEAAALKAKIITAEVGVNMRANYTIEQYTNRAIYIIDALRAANPKAIAILITAFTNSDHYPAEASQDVHLQNEFDHTLRELVTKPDDKRLHILEGKQLLPDFTLLCSDVIHPSPSGHALIGERLAEQLKAMAIQAA